MGWCGLQGHWIIILLSDHFLHFHLGSFAVFCVPKGQGSDTGFFFCCLFCLYFPPVKLEEGQRSLSMIHPHLGGRIDLECHKKAPKVQEQYF